MEDLTPRTRGSLDAGRNEHMINSLEICEHAIPVLHTMMGMGNDAFKHFLEYIDQRHKLIGDEEREARERFWEASINVDTELDLYTINAEERQFQIVMLKGEEAGIKVRKKQKEHLTNRYLHSLAEQRQMNEEIKMVMDKIREIKADDK
jgi:hypothetical protein